MSANKERWCRGERIYNVVTPGKTKKKSAQHGRFKGRKLVMKRSSPNVGLSEMKSEHKRDSGKRQRKR